MNHNTKKFELNKKGLDYTHNHELDEKSLTKKQKDELFSYMKVSELEKHHGPKMMLEKGESYIQGRINDSDFKIPVKQGSYLLSKAKKEIWGPATKDAEY